MKRLRDGGSPCSPRARLPGLRQLSLSKILIFVALGSAFLPGVLVSAIFTLTHGHIAEGPIMRMVVATEEVAKAVALGAGLGAMALPLVRALESGGRDGAAAFIERVAIGFRAAMLLSGSRNLEALRRGILGFDPEFLASAREIAALGGGGLGASGGAGGGATADTAALRGAGEGAGLHVADQGAGGLGAGEGADDAPQ